MTDKFLTQSAPYIRAEVSMVESQQVYLYPRTSWYFHTGHLPHTPRRAQEGHEGGVFGSSTIESIISSCLLYQTHNLLHR